MFCPYCGRSCPEDHTFCMGCGKRLPAMEAASAQGASPSPSGYVQPAPAPVISQNPKPSEPDRASPEYTRRGLKEFATSPLVLATAAVMALLVLFNLISAFNASSSIVDSIEDVLYSVGLGSSEVRIITGGLDELLEDTSLDESLTLMSLLGALPGALVTLGIWLVIISAFNRYRSYTDTSGLALIRVVYTVQLVSLCVAFGIAALVLMSSCSELSSVASEASGTYMEDTVDALYNTFVTVILIFFAVAAVVITYYVKLRKMVEQIKDSFDTGIPDSDLPMSVIVVCFIMGGISAIGLLSGDSDAFLATLLSAGSQILMGVTLCRLRSEMGVLEYARRNYKKPPESNPASAADYQQVPAWKRVEMEREASNRS